jgi:hypothetical protein
MGKIASLVLLSMDEQKADVEVHEQMDYSTLRVGWEDGIDATGILLVQQ